MANYYLSGYTPPTGIDSREKVMAAQRELNTKGASLKVDGIWGPKTNEASALFGASTTVGDPMKTYIDDMTRGLSSFFEGYSKLFEPARMEYTPPSRAQISRDFEAMLRPGVEAAIVRRREQTGTNRAELDADAYARGMGASTYLTDMKSRQMEYEQDDITALEGEYSSALADAVYKTEAQERERAFAAQQYNLQQQEKARGLAMEYAQSAYAQYLSAQQAAAAAAQASGKKSAGIGKTQKDEYLEMLANMPAWQRAYIYEGKGADGPLMKQELIGVLGASGFLKAQAMYPGD